MHTPIRTRTRTHICSYFSLNSNGVTSKMFQRLESETTISEEGRGGEEEERRGEGTMQQLAERMRLRPGLGEDKRAEQGSREWAP